MQAIGQSPTRPRCQPRRFPTRPPYQPRPFEGHVRYMDAPAQDHIALWTREERLNFMLNPTCPAHILPNPLIPRASSASALTGAEVRLGDPRGVVERPDGQLLGAGICQGSGAGQGELPPDPSSPFPPPSCPPPPLHDAPSQACVAVYFHADSPTRRLIASPAHRSTDLMVLASTLFGRLDFR